MATNENIKKALATISCKRLSSQMRELMPLIDEKIRAGATYDEIIDALKDAGLAVNPNTFRSYLYRYRKKQALSPAQTSAMISKKTLPSPILKKENELNPSLTYQPAPIKNREDLVKLREMDIDIEALARIGRLSRGEKK